MVAFRTADELLSAVEELPVAALDEEDSAVPSFPEEPSEQAKMKSESAMAKVKAKSKE
ncbi:hypothetical protein AGMMS49938_00630 [Fibrobacterales bacterium]|nr:hypothetical protein AGMMS49938_00630 [Fibrobacterales bacterium]